VIAAVIVTHAAPADVVDACIASVLDAGGIERVFVVDNGDAARRSAVAARLVARTTTTAPVELLAVPNNGYGAAANKGFGRALAAGATAVAVLNDDVTVRPGWLRPLADALGEAGVGAAQPKLLVAGSDPPVVNSLGVAIGPDGAGTDIGDGETDGDSGSGARPIDAFTGGAVLLSADYLRATGGFDPRWFLYYEDADLAARGRALGWRYVVALDAVVEHARGATTATMSDRTRYLQERNRLWHAARHRDAATFARALWLSVRRLRHPPYSVHARALAVGLTGAPLWWWRRLRHRDALTDTILTTAPPA
jgi:N-acetylglucosaminyl-diphospho-decaprenol L-rhamnosyltransferase